MRAAACHASAAQAVHSVRLAKGEVIIGPDPGFIGYRLPNGGELTAQAELLREIVGNPFVGAPAAGGAQTPNQTLHLTGGA